MQKRIICICLLFAGFLTRAEDGSRLWLRYEAVGEQLKETILGNVSGIFTIGNDPSLQLAASELQLALHGFTGVDILVSSSIQHNSILLVLAGSREATRLGLRNELSALHKDGYIIRRTVLNNRAITVVASPTPVGVLYGVFHLIRAMQTGVWHADLAVVSKPAYDLRMLNHWDNLDGTVERGYAGYSLWKWDELPASISPRYAEYARANASIGINGMVPNNVNANPLILSDAYLPKLKTLADIFRPYGIQLFISVNFYSPVAVGNLTTADPLDDVVRAWWMRKVNEIYRAIPDFGGFLVKANSEGQPGPLDYGRTHVDGANMLAAALKPHGGLVIWRAFVYDPDNLDRAVQAYLEFVPDDGAYADNVIIQVKNGPVDFQPREPFSPLFGGMEKTPTMVEFQITQEYTGFSNHLVFLAPMFEECLKSDTYAHGEGSTVGKMTDGSLVPTRRSAIAGVANIGEDVNWCGHHFAQANWYAFGRQAWDHTLDSNIIADEWLQMTFTNNKHFVEPVKAMMIDSREAPVNYMMPLGLHHLFAWGHHYGPEPWCDIPGARPDWLPRYYHNASAKGIGFDRTRSGSAAVDQYHPPLNDLYNDIDTCPEEFFLWFHFVPWDHVMKSGRILWDELSYKYQQGVEEVREFQKIWDRMEDFVDHERFSHVQSRLRIQARDAVWWRDACLLYFQTYSKLSIPYELERPIHDLEDLKKIKLDMKHHN